MKSIPEQMSELVKSLAAADKTTAPQTLRAIGEVVRIVNNVWREHRQTQAATAECLQQLATVCETVPARLRDLEQRLAAIEKRQ